MTKPNIYQDDNLVDKTEEEKLDIVWERRDLKAHFEPFIGKQFEWTLQESQIFDNRSRADDINSGKSY